ncbi:MAG: hypothetical protein NZ556_05020 [Fimbriimonadales bacterium]|nr:hypothetical protein [Fimbriimonadales bacterium]
MRRWAIHAAHLVSLLWATVFLSVSLLHPLTHNPLQHDGGDCFACVLHKTPTTPPPALHDLLQSLTKRWEASLSLHAIEADAHSRSPALQPRIPRAPPA